jgi:hypothetical protein
MSYMSRPEPTSIASSYRQSSNYVDVHRTTTRSSSSSSFFTLSFLSIPVLLVVLFQWLTGSCPELFHLDEQAGGATRSPIAAASGVMPHAYGWHPAQGAAAAGGSWPWSGDLVPFGTRTRDGRTTQLEFPTGYGPASWIWVDIGVCFFWAFCCFPCCWDRVLVPHTTLLLRSHMLLLPLPPSAFPGRCFFLRGHLQSTKQCGDHQALYVLLQFDLDI